MNSLKRLAKMLILEPVEGLAWIQEWCIEKYKGYGGSELGKECLAYAQELAKHPENYPKPLKTIPWINMKPFPGPPGEWGVREEKCTKRKRGGVTGVCKEGIRLKYHGTFIIDGTWIIILS